MVLRARDQTFLAGHPRVHVEKTLSGLRRFAQNARWVGKSNHYSSDIISKLQADDVGGQIRNPRHLAQYICASSILHCTDGWSYLGKALLSLLRGDPHRARHLAYYAELRAAMSLLATEGIGVFKNRHVGIVAPNSAIVLETRSQTHVFVWDCLEFWASQGTSGRLFSMIVRPYGRSLDDWLAPLGGGVAVAPQAQEWFRLWGVDLKVLPMDRDARNKSSYRPDGMPDAWQIDPSSALEFVSEVWTALEPSPGARFHTIDQYILRFALEAVFRSRTGGEPIQQSEEFHQFAVQVVDHQNFARDVTRRWIDFMTRNTAKTDPLIFKLSQQTSGMRDNSDTAIISRATLLLSVAAGSTAEIFRCAGFNADSLSFWWKGLAENRGISGQSPEHDELVDLWADVSTSLGEIKAFKEQVPTAHQTFFRIGTELARTVAELGGCERVAIWSITD